MREKPESLSIRPARANARKSHVQELGMDVLSHVLDTLGLESRIFCRSVLSAPWAMALPAGE